MAPYKFKCEFCDFRCTRIDSMATHVLSVHEKKKPLECGFREYSCNQKGDMAQHVLSVHEKKKPSKCHICGYVFLERSYDQASCRCSWGKETIGL